MILLLPFLHLCHFFPSLTVLARTSSRMLNRSGESGQLWIVPDLRGKASNISTLITLLVIGVVQLPIIWRMFPPIPFFAEKFYLFIYLFIYFWLCWVFVSVQGLSLVVASGGHSSSRCVGLSLSRPLLLRSTGSRRAGSVVVAHGPSCSAACEIFPDQGSNPCPLHWQADSQPLRHQGSPRSFF